jgi:hypothetical protein
MPSSESGSPRFRVNVFNGKRDIFGRIYAEIYGIRTTAVTG